MLRIDSYDNNKGNFIVRADDFPTGMDPDGGLFVKSSGNGNGFGIGAAERFALERTNPQLFSEILDMEARYKGAFSRFVQNEMNRKLGLFRRVADDDSIYYVLNRSQLDELKKLVKPKPIEKIESPFKLKLNKDINDEFVKKYYNKNNVDEFNDMVVRWGNELPDGHLNKNFEILMKGQDKFDRTSVGLYSHTTDRMGIAVKRKIDDVRHTFFHEIGHRVDHKAVKSIKTEIKGQTPKFRVTSRKVWSKLTEKYHNAYNSRRPSDGYDYFENFNYPFSWLKADVVDGGFWRSEFFAQSYSEYVVNSKKLKKHLPDVYKFMKEIVFNGKEYI